MDCTVPHNTLSLGTTFEQGDEAGMKILQKVKPLKPWALNVELKEKEQNFCASTSIDSPYQDYLLDGTDEDEDETQHSDGIKEETLQEDDDRPKLVKQNNKNRRKRKARNLLPKHGMWSKTDGPNYQIAL